METYKKAKYCSAAIWVLGFFLLWELVALLLDKGLQDPMAYKKLPYFHQVILEFGNYGSNLVTQAGITLSRAGQGFFWGALAVTASILVDTLSAKDGIGYVLVLTLYGGGTTGQFWPAVLLSSLMGVLSFVIVSLAEFLCIPWKRQEAKGGDRR